MEEIIDLDSFKNPEELYEEVINYNISVSVFTVTEVKGNGEVDVKNYVYRFNEAKEGVFTEGTKEDFLEDLKSKDAVVVRSYTGKMISGSAEVKIRAYTISRGEVWSAVKMNAWELRENCSRDPETGDLMIPKAYEEYC